MKRLRHKTAVVVARQFNPAILSDRWLVHEDIVSEEEFDGDCERIYAPGMSKISTNAFELLALPDRVQMIVKPDGWGRAEELIAGKMRSLVTTLEHTPYIAIGLNFSWQIAPEDGNLTAFTKSRFIREDTPFFRIVDSDASSYGAVVAKDAFGGNLKIIATPDSDSDVDCLVVDLNYHFQLNQLDNPLQEIGDILDQWAEIDRDAEHIVNSMLE